MNRKLSPHLSIYKFPMTAISSITNRVSGMYLTGIGLFCCFFTLTNENFKNICYVQYSKLDYYPQKILHCFFIYPMGYHFMGGLRHLIWDSFPKLLTKNQVLKSSKFLFVASIIPTLALENKIAPKFKREKLQSINTCH